MVLPLQLQLNFPSERVEIMGKEFERKRSQGFNDVFTASPFSDRKVPILDVRLLYMPQSNPLLLTVGSDVQFIQTHNLTPCRR